MPATRSAKVVVFPDGTTDRAGIAAYLGQSTRTIDRWVLARKIPFQRRTSRILRFRISDVERALNRLNVKEVG